MKTYILKTKFQKDTTHLGSESNNTTINIEKTTPNLDIYIPTGTYNAGDTFNIVVQPKHPDGTNVWIPRIPLKIYIDNALVKSDTTQQEGYSGTLTIPSESTGGISIKVVLEEDSEGYYNSTSKTVVLQLGTPTSTAVDTTLTLTADKSSVEVGDEVTLTATLKTKSSGTALSGHSVIFKRGDSTIDVGYTNSSGVATKKVTINNKGSSSFNAVFEGYADKYNASSANVTVNGVVTSIQPTLVMSSSSNIYRGWSLKLLYVDNNSQPLANKTVNITINGVTYQRATDSEGIASLKINLTGSSYSFSANVEANGNYLSASCNGTVNLMDPIVVERRPGCVSWDGASAPYKAWDSSHKYADGDVYNQAGDEYYLSSGTLASKSGTYKGVQPLRQACFGFKIPDGSVIQKLEAVWIHRYNRSNSNVNVEAGTVYLDATGQDTIALQGSTAPGANTWTINNASTTDVSGVSANALNQNAFQAKISYNTNQNYNTGELHLGWFSIKVTYTPPQP